MASTIIPEQLDYFDEFQKMITDKNMKEVFDSAIDTIYYI